MHQIPEELRLFLENPNIYSFYGYFKKQTGEHDYIDYKREWMDQDKTSKHILGFANSGGGCLVMGIEEKDSQLEPKGLDSIKDPTKEMEKMEKYIPSKLDYTIYTLDFPKEDIYESFKGKKLQIIIVKDTPEYVPFISMADGKDIKRDSIYYRAGVSTDLATNEQIENMIERRLDASKRAMNIDMFSNHLSQLKTLYGSISETSYEPPFGILVIQNIFNQKKIKNKFYPDENFDEFVVKMIDKKKRIIEKIATQQ